MIVASLLAALAGLSLVADEPEAKPPDAMAKPLTAFAWKSKNDLRFI